jgi:hypothetical protein
MRDGTGREPHAHADHRKRRLNLITLPPLLNPSEKQRKADPQP